MPIMRINQPFDILSTPSNLSIKLPASPENNI